MHTSQRVSLALLRISMGWLFFYAGFEKLMDPSWSAASYLAGAKTFSTFYQLLLRSDVLPLINLINEWGLFLLGVSLILGLFTRLSAALGIALMLLYYFPILNFPYPNAHSFLVDEHIIYIFILFVLCAFKAGRVWGFDARILTLTNKSSAFRELIG